MKFIFELLIIAVIFYVVPMTIIDLIDLPSLEGIAQHWLNLARISIYGAVLAAEFAIMSRLTR